MSNESIKPQKLKTIATQSGSPQGFKYENSVPFEMPDYATVAMIGLQCQNIPVGTIIGFSCPQPGPNPPIYLAPTTVPVPNFSPAIQSNIPANFKGTIDYYAYFEQQPPADASLTVFIAIPAND